MTFHFKINFDPFQANGGLDENGQPINPIPIKTHTNPLLARIAAAKADPNNPLYEGPPVNNGPNANGNPAANQENSDSNTVVVTTGNGTANKTNNMTTNPSITGNGMASSQAQERTNKEKLQAILGQNNANANRNAEQVLTAFKKRF